MTARGHFLYNSLSKSSKYDLWLLCGISFTIPYRQFPLQFPIKIIEIWPMTARGHFLYMSLSKSLKDDLWLLGAISFTIPHHMIEIWPMTVMGNVPLQFLIKFIEIWHLTARGNVLYNSLSKPLEYNLWLQWSISFTIPYPNRWNMTYDC